VRQRLRVLGAAVGGRADVDPVPVRAQQFTHAAGDELQPLMLISRHSLVAIGVFGHIVLELNAKLPIASRPEIPPPSFIIPESGGGSFASRAPVSAGVSASRGPASGVPPVSVRPASSSVMPASSLSSPPQAASSAAENNRGIDQKRISSTQHEVMHGASARFALLGLWQGA
jgi:hypothetical protein